MTRLLMALVLGFCLAACSSSTAPSTTSTGVGISPVGISPSSLTVQTGQVVQFLVWGGNFPPVTLPAQGFAWSVAGTGCSGASCGTIDAKGRYSAPTTVPDLAIVAINCQPSRRINEVTGGDGYDQSTRVLLSEPDFGSVRQSDG